MTVTALFQIMVLPHRTHSGKGKKRKKKKNKKSIKKKKRGNKVGVRGKVNSLALKNPNGTRAKLGSQFSSIPTKIKETPFSHTDASLYTLLRFNTQLLL